MSYVYAGYGVTLVALASYALRVVTRERALRKTTGRPSS
jgi:heme exporter protein D